MHTITRIHGREILDSRGNPTVEVDVWAGDVLGRAAVPSGASTGEREALELRDGDKSRYLGKGVRTAVAHVNGEIAQALVGQPLDQRAVDEAMIALDGTPAKSRLGANALLGVSMATARAAAAAAKPPALRPPRRAGRDCARSDAPFALPVPMMNILNGGAHADSSVDLQEFMVMPVGHADLRGRGPRGRGDLPRAARHPQEGRALDRRRRRRRVRAQPASPTRKRWTWCSRRSARRATRPARTCISRSTSRRASSGTTAATCSRSRASPPGRRTRWSRCTPDWVRQYPIVSIEDGLAENDWAGWKAMTRALGDRVQLVGDDVFVTNPEILQRGIAEGVGNSILVKLNQIGTVSETLDAIAMARAAGYTTVISHRSGETEDTHHRRPGGRHLRRADQDRFGQPQRSGGEVQPAAAHRRRAGRGRALRRPERAAPDPAGRRLTASRDEPS